MTERDVAKDGVGHPGYTFNGYYDLAREYTMGDLYGPFYEYDPRYLNNDNFFLLARYADLLEYAEYKGWEKGVAISNLAYYGGYCNRANQLYIYETLQIEHPVFGMDEPTPEEAFAKGQELGREFMATKTDTTTKAHTDSNHDDGTELMPGRDVKLPDVKQAVKAAKSQTYPDYAELGEKMADTITAFVGEWNINPAGDHLGKYVQKMEDAAIAFYNAE